MAGKKFRNKTLPTSNSNTTSQHAQPLQIAFSTRTKATDDLALRLNKRLFNPDDWKYYYYEYKYKDVNEKFVKQDLRKLIQMGTLQTLLRGKYFLEDTNVVKEQSHDQTHEIPIHERVFIRKPYVPRKKLEVSAEVEEEPETKKKKKKKKNKNPKQEELCELSDEDELVNNDDSTFEGFEIMKEEERPPLDEIIELNERNLKLKKTNPNKHPQKQQSKKSSTSNEEEEETFFFDEGVQEKVIPTITVHLDFNGIKKICKSTEYCDCSELDAVQRVASLKRLPHQHYGVHHHYTHSGDSTTSHPSTNQSADSTIIQVVNNDLLNTALEMKKHKLHPLVLVSGHQSVPGGTYSKGGNTQEDDLCRRTSLSLCLADPYHLDETRGWRYPIPEFGGIYVPNCLVIRKSKSEGYAFLSKPTSTSFFVTSPYINPPTERKQLLLPHNHASSGIANSSQHPGDHSVSSFENFLPSKLAASMRKKIASYFSIALSKGHDSLVIGAFGCENSHSNPAFHISNLFLDVLNFEAFRNKFKYVVFALDEDQEPDSKLTSIIEDVDENTSVIDHSDEKLGEKKSTISIFCKVLTAKEDPLNGFQSPVNPVM
ncbi:hypothetical protein FDP41_008054 [Naegleria fowleri]|uniref:Microbial-type PARG catalytic domain-containing protein n=1 Tax=Naegleria fowleri TaxID=5763 RepID=A0A6A5CFQ9_NAEFO|nr:uncharacterized protein FDP41_008054 [Naegleria fowleri]KAF0984139.1 hypothetical protein FDP41_008054 [Naegleria fowleri]